MKQVIHKSRAFTLIKDNVKNPKKRGKGHAIYKIKTEGWFTSAELEEIRDIVDPLRNIAGHDGYDWKFKDLATARKKYTMLLLKWA